MTSMKIYVAVCDKQRVLYSHYSCFGEGGMEVWFEFSTALYSVEVWALSFSWVVLVINCHEPGIHLHS